MHIYNLMLAVMPWVWSGRSPMSHVLTFVYIELAFHYNLTVKIQKSLEQGTEVTGVMAVRTSSGFCMEDR